MQIYGEIFPKKLDFCPILRSRVSVGLEFITRGILEDLCQELLHNCKIRVEVCY